PTQIVLFFVMQQASQIIAGLSFLHDPHETSKAVVVASILGERKTKILNVGSIAGFQIRGLLEAFHGRRPVRMTGLTNSQLIPEGRPLGINRQRLEIVVQRALPVLSRWFRLSQALLGV